MIAISDRPRVKRIQTAPFFHFLHSIKEIGNINEIKIEDLEPILKPHYISKEKVKKKIEELEKQRDKADKEDKIGTGIVLTGGIRYLEELLGE